MERAEVLIIGSGQGGSMLAGKLAKGGKRVLLIERSHLGGSCVNIGCTPSKALLAAAHAAGGARRAATLGINAKVDVDFLKVMQRVRDIRDEWRQSIGSLEQTENLQIVYADARFVGNADDGKPIVEADGRRFTADRIVINTGRRSRIPDIQGLAETPYLTAETVWDIKQQPQRIVVLGGGYVGLELGQALARLGSEVHIIDQHDHVLSREPQKVGQVLQDALAEDGITFHLKQQPQRVKHFGDRFNIELPEGECIESDALLVAAGRISNTEALNLESVGVELDDKGDVRVNDHFETTADDIYAIGDCAGQPPFTHVSHEDGVRLLAIWNGEDRTRDDRTLGYGVFTDPQVGRAGMTVEQAQQAGHTVMERSREVDQIARGREWAQERGFIQLVADEGNGRLLGATFVCHEATELVQIVLPLIEQRATWQALDKAILIHPTYGEAIKSLAGRFGD
jgi:dihydrolipoamide dehydrogenase